MTDSAHYSQTVSHHNIPSKVDIVELLLRLRQKTNLTLHEIPGAVDDIPCIRVISASIELIKQIDNLIESITCAVRKEGPVVYPPHFVTLPPKSTTLRKPTFHIGGQVNRVFKVPEINNTERQRALTPIYIKERNEMDMLMQEQHDVHHGVITNDDTNASLTINKAKCAELMVKLKHKVMQDVNNSEKMKILTKAQLKEYPDEIVINSSDSDGDDCESETSVTPHDSNNDG